MNVAALVGRLTKDPQLRYTPSGVACCTFTLAVDNPFSKDNDNKADFLPIVVWRQAAEASANYLKKGRLCAVEGRISTRNYENNEGKRVYVTEIIASNVRFLESARNDQQGNNAPPTGNNDPFQGDGKPIDISDDDLPF